jgi:uncharacterized protein (TIGR02147 family)
MTSIHSGNRAKQNTLSEASGLNWLRSEYEKRLAKNPAFSIRAFARFLNMSPGHLSDVLSEKRPLTPRLAMKLLDLLEADPESYKSILKALKAKRSKSTIKPSSADIYVDLGPDAFAAIADWQHFAILSLIKLKSFRRDPKWIAARLGISTVTVRSSLDRLIKLGMLEELPGGGLVRTTENYVTTNGVPSAAIRASHRQSLEQAIAALEEVPLELRDITSITFPTNLAQIDKVRPLIKSFQRKIAKMLEEGDATAVYNLNTQLVPVTKERNITR